MREYLFRGKTIETNAWVHGGIFVQDDRYFIIHPISYSCGTVSYGLFEVDPETVGQYVDQVDCKDTPIFEGDIVYVESEDECAEIAWDADTSSFVISFGTWYTDFDHFYGYELDVVGNIFDEE